MVGLPQETCQSFLPPISARADGPAFESRDELCVPDAHGRRAFRRRRWLSPTVERPGDDHTGGRAYRIYLGLRHAPITLRPEADRHVQGAGSPTHFFRPSREVDHEKRNIGLLS
jgi:hypothetical protein